MAHRIIYKPSGIILSSTLGDIAIAVEGDYVDVLLTTTAQTILSENFLTTLPIRRITPNSSHSLFLFAQSGESKSYSVHYSFRRLSDGSILHLRNCISLRYNFYGGWRNIKTLASGECRIIGLPLCSIKKSATAASSA